MNTILLASLLSLAGTHQSGSTLYRPGISLKDQAISLRSWGSGICSETEEDAFEGSTSIRVTTKNLFQGGILSWEKPVDLAASYPDKANLLRITFKSLDATVSSGGGAGAVGGGKGKGGAGGFGGLDGGDGGGKGGGPQGGGGRPGGGPGFGAPGGGAVGGGAGSASVSTLKMMRIIIATTDGMKSEAFIPAATTVGIDRGWKQAGIPLQAIKGFDKSNKIIKNISFSGDVSTAFYLGDIRVINDRTPIRGETSFRTAVSNVNSSLTFSATGYGGSSILKYSWDFDDADGIQADAEGQSVKYTFRTASNDLTNASTRRPNGEFTITLTISDTFGLKDPYSTTIKVKVN
ncbi:MAG: PKD domain-containing protein [Armatimonadota bacterium]